MRRKLKQKRHNFEITEILIRRNFEADTERGDANRVMSVIYFSIWNFVFDAFPLTVNISLWTYLNTPTFLIVVAMV